jgi:hypothetical protein
MVWAPSEQNRTAVKFWLDFLQVVTVIAGVSTAVATFVFHSIDQRTRAADLERNSREQLTNVRRELQRPYEEKKLNLYLDAARVLAHLATSPSVDKENTEARFWELYWGELAFVESRTEDEKSRSNPSVERLMVQFCHQYFGAERCTTGGGSSGSAKDSRTPTERAAIEMARGASQEIRAQWLNLQVSSEKPN